MKIFRLLPLLFLFTLCNSQTENEAKDNEEFNFEIVEVEKNIVKQFNAAEVMPYIKDGWWGYADKNGAIVIPCIYDACGFFSEGMAWVKKDGRYGYIDTLGKLKIDFQYFKANNFIYGLAIVQSEKYKGVIDKSNNIILSFEYEDLKFADDSLVCFKQNQQWGIINLKGEELVNPIYDNSFDFHKGFAVVRRNNKYGVVNSVGEEIIKSSYHNIMQTKGNYFIVVEEENYKEKRYGVLNTNGNTVIPFIYKNIEEAINNCVIVDNGIKMGLLNNRNDTLLDFSYKKMKPGNTNLIAVSGGTGAGYINYKGDTIIPFEFSEVEEFYFEHAIVYRDDFGVINNRGESTVPCNYKKIIHVDKDIVKVYNDEDKYGFYNVDGTKLTECIYDDLNYSLNGYENFMRINESEDKKEELFVNNMAIVSINGRFGAINKKGKQVIEPYYHTMTDFDEYGIALVMYNNKKGLVNNQGKVIVPTKYDNIAKDDATGYYYSYFFDRKENIRQKNNAGYFDFTGKLWSANNKEYKEVESEENVVLEIRKSYNRIIEEIKNVKTGKSISVGENVFVETQGKRITVNNKSDKLVYEYYYDEVLNKDEPFFILKADNSSEKVMYDRFYFKNRKIVRWVDKNGKKQIVANAEFAPENIELFIARKYKAAYYNELTLINSKHNQEVENIRRTIAKIDDDITKGNYKRGKVYDSFEGSGGEGEEEYVDSKGELIYRKEYDGGDYHSSVIEQYYQNSKIIYSKGENSQNMNLMAAGNYSSGELQSSNSETFYFKDGSQREYEEKQFDNGTILFISE